MSNNDENLDSSGAPLDAQGESDSDDEYYENPIEVIREFGNHPLMAKAQKALSDELNGNLYRLQVELIDKTSELKRLGQDRETLGIQLYSLQQQLARLQIALENAHTEFNSVVDKRLQEEDILKKVEETNSEQKLILKEHERQQKKYQSELDALSETIRQIETYNEEVQSEISITRRATYKAEQSMQTLEKQKVSQDLYVDTLNKQVKQLQEQISLHVGQLSSQQQETIEANKIIDDTIRELDLISNEKKQLLTQWKAALSGLSRRDLALSQATQTLLNAESAVHDYDVEIDAAKRRQQSEQAQHESLVSIRDRLESELQWVDENLNKLKVEREQLQERYTLLTKSLAQTNAESKRVELVSKQIGADADATLQNLQVVIMERQRLESELQTLVSAHSNVNKAVDNLNKDCSRVLKRIHEKENEASEVENEIARTKVDTLNSSTLLDQLKDQLQTVQRELSEKESLIEKYQIEIRQRTDEIEKKMYRVDRLNKKYEKMVESAGGEENLGPLESTIRTLRKEIETVLEECKNLERDWLKRQTELVGVASEGEKCAESNTELQARTTILTQQQLRLTKDLRNLKGDVKAAQQSNIDLQKDVSKLNVLISQNHEQEGELQNVNYTLEIGCIEELKELEKESISLQSQINQAKASKDGMLDQIVEEERQALLWEKKIQLDKETREALDPSVGQQETQNMEREIHRMSLRLDALKREQERLSSEMERAILKRSVIANRFKGKHEIEETPKDRTSKHQNLTQATAKKRIASLKKDARALAEETTRYTGSIQERKDQMSRTTSDLEKVTAEYSETNDECFRLQSQVNDLLYQKQLNQERLSYRKKYSKLLKDLSQNNIDLSQSLQVERRLVSSSQALENVREIILGLSRVQPHLNEVLNRVVAMTEPMLS